VGQDPRGANANWTGFRYKGESGRDRRPQIMRRKSLRVSGGMEGGERLFNAIGGKENGSSGGSGCAGEKSFSGDQSCTTPHFGIKKKITKKKK